MILEVTKVFNEALVERFSKKPEVLNFLLRHERKTRCLENLCEQIRLTEFKATVKLDARRYRLMIRTVADLFAKAALEAKHQELLSEAEKKRIAKEADAIKEAETVLHEVKGA